jgi:hypothetical protein
MWADVRQAAITSRFESIPDKIFVTHYRNLKQISLDHGIAPTYSDEELQCFWYWGDAGTGKSWAARHDFQDDYYIKETGTFWWCGYKYEPTVIIDDFDKRDGDKFLHKLKIWADKYPFPAEVKGGMMNKIRPKTFIVTSNYHPQAIWNKKEDIQPILRRFKVIHFKKLEQQPEDVNIVFKNDEVRGAYVKQFNPPKSPSILYRSNDTACESGNSTTLLVDESIIEPVAPFSP